MTKQSGIGANFYVDGYDLSGDTNSLGTISKSLVPIPMQGIDKGAFERLPGQLNGELSWVSYFNPTNAHTALSTLPRTDRVASYLHRAALGVPAASMVNKQLGYDPKRDSNGGLMLDVNAKSNACWIDWGYTLTPGKRTDVAATNGTGVDFGNPAPAAFNFGLQAYLHVFAFTGTNVTIKLQSSTDNAVGDPYSDVTGGAFTVVTSAPQGQRIQTARNQTIERWLRVVTTGTFTSVTFAVIATVNITDMTI